MDFVNVLDMGSDGIAQVVELAAKIKADPSSVAGTRSGLRVGLFFEKPSTRTRVSCEVGTAELGDILEKREDLAALRFKKDDRLTSIHVMEGVDRNIGATNLLAQAQSSLVAKIGFGQITVVTHAQRFAH